MNLQNRKRIVVATLLLALAIAAYAWITQQPGGWLSCTVAIAVLAWLFSRCEVAEQEEG